MTPKELHNKAMSLYEESLALKSRGHDSKRFELLEEAFSLESTAAMMLKDRLDLEPTRSKLFASAATMGYQLKKFRESEILISHGLSGEPKEMVLEELRDLFDRVNFLRHLHMKGRELVDDEFRFTISSGSEVMKGLAKDQVVLERVMGVGAVYTRTVERMNKRPYRFHGKKKQQDDDVATLYYETPIAASFAIIIKVTQPITQQKMPLVSYDGRYVDEMLECFDLMNSGKMKELKERIGDMDYFQSFVINARKVAPDGTDVKQVGFTVHRNKQQKIYPLTIVQSDIHLEEIIPVKESERESSDEKTITTITGYLDAANATKKSVELTTEIERRNKKGRKLTPKKVKRKVVFSNVAQKELVRNYYEEYVTFKVYQFSDSNKLEFIDVVTS